MVEREPERWYCGIMTADDPAGILMAVTQLQQGAVADDRYLGEIRIISHDEGQLACGWAYPK
jgi:hypothetical protein